MPPVNMAAAVLSGLPRRPSTICSQAQPQARWKAAAGENHGAELGARHLGRHGRLFGQRVADRPLRVAEIARAGECRGGHRYQGWALIQSRVASPSSRSLTERVELALGFVGAAAGLQHDVKAALGIDFGRPCAKPRQPIGQAHQDGGVACPAVCGAKCSVVSVDAVVHRQRGCCGARMTPHLRLGSL